MTLEILIAGLELPRFGYFMGWAALGQVAMILVQVKRYFPRIKDQGGFQPLYWWKDNWMRILFSFLTALALSPIAVLVALKSPDGLTEFACIGAGAIIDKTVESFTNKKKP